MVDKSKAIREGKETLKNIEIIKTKYRQEIESTALLFFGMVFGVLGNVEAQIVWDLMESLGSLRATILHSVFVAAVFFILIQFRLLNNAIKNLMQWRNPCPRHKIT